MGTGDVGGWQVGGGRARSQHGATAGGALGLCGVRGVQQPLRQQRGYHGAVVVSVGEGEAAGGVVPQQVHDVIGPARGRARAIGAQPKQAGSVELLSQSSRRVWRCSAKVGGECGGAQPKQAGSVDVLSQSRREVWMCSAKAGRQPMGVHSSSRQAVLIMRCWQRRCNRGSQITCGSVSAEGSGGRGGMPSGEGGRSGGRGTGSGGPRTGREHCLPLRL